MHIFERVQLGLYHSLLILRIFCINIFFFIFPRSFLLYSSNSFKILLNLLQVIRDRKWKEVIVVFNFPTTITSASFVLRKYYLSLLYHFEQVYCFNKQAPPISMPGNRHASSLSKLIFFKFFLWVR